MNALPMDLGVCGVEQMLHAGTVKFDDENAADGIALYKLPKGIIVTRAVAVVGTAFSAGTLTVGGNDDVNDILGADDITETTAGTYSKQTFAKYMTDTTIEAKLTGTATAGEADIYLFVVRIPPV